MAVEPEPLFESVEAATAFSQGEALAGVRWAFGDAPWNALLDAVPEPARSAVDIGVPTVAGAGYTLALLPDVAASAGAHGACARGSDGGERFVDAEATGGGAAAGCEWAGGAVSLSSAAAGLSVGELKLLVASKLLQLSLAVRSSPSPYGPPCAAWCNINRTRLASTFNPKKTSV